MRVEKPSAPTLSIGDKLKVWSLLLVGGVVAE
jgi:hypothetical protein